MSKRLFFLADGTLKTVSAGRFRGDDNVVTKTITEQIVVNNQGQVQGASAAVHMDPDNPEGPLVIRYKADTGQQGLSVVRETAEGDEEVFEIENDGSGDFKAGLSAIQVTTDFLVAKNVSGDAFDDGEWVFDNTIDVPTEETAIMRNSTLEVVRVSNLRVGTRTKTPHSWDQALNNGAGGFFPEADGI